MKTVHPGESLPLWLDQEEIPNFPRLNDNLNVDVCVIGAGLGGLTTAYLLAKEGKRVCVLEGNHIGSGQTGRTTAHLTVALDDRYFEIEKLHGQEGARLAAESHRTALEKVAEIVRTENIDCDFKRVDGYLFAPEGSKEILSHELAAVHRAGLDVQVLNRAPLEPFDTGLCLRFPNQIQLHPVKYLKGLAEKFVALGGTIFNQTLVVNIQSGNPASVTTRSGHTVKADSVVVATNTPINNIFAIHTKQAPYRSYVLGFEIPRGAVAHAMYWDTLDPYHYINVWSVSSNPDSEVLIVGGEDHRTGQKENPKSCYSELEKWTRQRFPMAGRILYRWSGQIMEPVDSLAYLGHNPMDRNNVYVITGDSGNGLGYCTIGGLLITDQIMGRKNPWESLYNPSRISFRALANYMRENANVAAQYTDYLHGEKISDVKDIKNGEGAVLQRGLEKIAAYKDNDGHVQFFSAACPHLGGIVSWNSAEKSWDCPCHGSRFDCHGRVMAGPAVKDLSPSDHFMPEGIVPEKSPNPFQFMPPLPM